MDLHRHDTHRRERVTESLREELQELINYELSDPRIGGVTVTEALVSPDYRHAHVRLALQGTPEEQERTLEGIEHAKSFLRHQLAGRLELFRVPDLHFEPDLPAGLAARAPQILRRIRKGRAKS